MKRPTIGIGKGGGEAKKEKGRPQRCQIEPNMWKHYANFNAWRKKLILIKSPEKGEAWGEINRVSRFFEAHKFAEVRGKSPWIFCGGKGVKGHATKLGGTRGDAPEKITPSYHLGGL